MDLQEALTEMAMNEKFVRRHRDAIDAATVAADELAGLIALTLLKSQHLPEIEPGQPVIYHFVVGHEVVHIWDTSHGWELAHEPVIAASPSLELKERHDVD